jgi:hypothetical protein
MRSNLANSIQRAQRILQSDHPSEDFIVFKILCDPDRCCCTGCWPEAWSAINSTISPAGPVEHEGDALVNADDGCFVIEDHESGPEIIALIGVVGGSITIIRTIIDIIGYFSRKRQRSQDSVPVKLHLALLQYHDAGGITEQLLTIEIPASESLNAVLESDVILALEKARKLLEQEDRKVST